MILILGQLIALSSQVALQATTLITLASWASLVGPATAFSIQICFPLNVPPIVIGGEICSQGNQENFFLLLDTCHSLILAFSASTPNILLTFMSGSPL